MNSKNSFSISTFRLRKEQEVRNNEFFQKNEIILIFLFYIISEFLLISRNALRGNYKCLF